MEEFAENLPILPPGVIDEILFKCGLETTKNVTCPDFVPITAIRKIFQTRIIVIDSKWKLNGTEEKFVNGDYYLYIGGYDRLIRRFDTFGDEIRKIQINYDNIDGDTFRKINENIIKKHTEQLTEIQIVAGNFLKFWTDISNDGKEAIQFPNVNKLVYTGLSFENSLNLNAIFPKLESFNIRSVTTFLRYGDVKMNTRCLDNVTNLKELKLEIGTNSLRKDELDRIFAKNTQISTLLLSLTGNIDIFRSIETLKNLRTLQIESDGRQFLTNFFSRSKSISFNIPTLKQLILRRCFEDDRIIDFINLFTHLETVNVRLSNGNNFIKSIGKLTHVKKLTTICSAISKFTLKEIFE